MLALASRGSSGADLKGIIEDGKLQFAHNRTTGEPLRPVEEYFLDAIATIRQNRRKYRTRRSAQPADAQLFGFKTE
jgi:hypothetical protein